MVENSGRSIKSDNGYLNQSFLYIPNTSIRADWVLIKKRLITALNAGSSDPDFTFKQWIAHAQQHYSLSSSTSSLNKEWRAKKIAMSVLSKSAEVIEFNAAVEKVYKGNESADIAVDNNKKLVDEEREYDQADIAQTMLTWLSGKYTVESTEEYPYLDKINKLTNLRQTKGKYAGSLSFKALSDLRNDFDSHMYWLHYIKPYLTVENEHAAPPKPGAHSPYISRGALELIHELDGLINIFMTVAPTFEFPKLLKYVPKAQLESLLDNTTIIPNGFSQFKEWLLPEIRFKKQHKAIKTELVKEVTKVWFCIHWISIIKDQNWQFALLSIYEGQVDELFISFIEACKQSESIKLQLEKLGVVPGSQVQKLINTAANNLSAFVQANYFILQQEQKLKNNSGNSKAQLSEYETTFKSIINNALHKRAIRVGKTLNKRKPSDETSHNKVDRYTRVKKSTSLANRMLPFIFYYSDMKKRYHHWFANTEARMKAEHIAEEKLDYGQVESGVDHHDEFNKQEALFVEELVELLFSFAHPDPDVRELKIMISAALVQKYYCTHSDKNISRYCSLALEQQLSLLPNLEGWNEIVQQVHEHINGLQKHYPNAGFDTFETGISETVAQFSALIANYESELTR